MAENKLILPDDPNYKKPLIMGDAYEQALTPKLAQEKRNANLDAQRKLDMAKSGDNWSGYANSAIAHAADPGMFKMAQSTGISNMMTQPMWFSPLHTPQNWQIASKRREIYQWSYISTNNPCFLVNYGDFSLIDIKDVYTKWQDDFQSRGRLYIQNDVGESAKPDICTKRYVEKKANRIKILGMPHILEITHDHKCIIVKREEIKCSHGVSKSKNCIQGVNSPTCIRAKCNKHETIDYNISTVDAKDVKKGDYVLVPFSTEVKESIIKTKEQARFAGHLASDGSISQNGPGVRFFMHPDEEEFVLDSISPVFDSFDAPVNPTLPKH